MSKQGHGPSKSLVNRNLPHDDTLKVSSSANNLVTGSSGGLEGGTGTGTGSHSGSTRNRSTSVTRRKSRPRLWKAVSGSHPKLIYSVDDDINEQEGDGDDGDANNSDSNISVKNDRDYIEGYNDALKALSLRRSSKSPLRKYQQTYQEQNMDDVDTVLQSLQNDRSRKQVRRGEQEQANERSSAANENENENGSGAGTGAGEGEGDGDGVGEEGYNDVANDIDDNNVNAADDDDDDDDDGSIRSDLSVDTLNLRERQNAINSTHPFGIKIWKPSLYKKSRSVATRAEEDIHDFGQRRPASRRFWGVQVTNLIWSFTAGLFIYVACLVGAAFVFIFSGFGLRKALRPYITAFLKLGRYWLYPFGKFVLLNKDQNYLDEDLLEGRTLNEFHQWRLQEEGRLFFAPPRRYTGANETTGLMKNLMKDHKGRPLRDAYSSLENEGQSPSAQSGSGSGADANAGSGSGGSHASSGPAVDDNTADNSSAIAEDLDPNDIKVRFFGRGDWSAGRIAFYLYFYVIIQPISYIIGFLCWLFVFTIPMANITGILNYHLRRHPLALDFEMEKDYYKKRELNPNLRNKKQLILLCTYRCCGYHYYKYTIDGTNIFFINLLSVVLFVIFDYYIFKEQLHWDSFLTDSNTVFCLCLFSIIPLAYFIGQAVASISAQSSMGVGAVINAFFSTIVEIFLYCVALDQAKGKLVEGSMIGSILGGVLLLPGLSMCGGALKRKTQRYNPRSAGVSSTMLLFAMVIMFAPSLFYQIYGAYEIKCNSCDVRHNLDDCTKCRFIQPSFTLDPLYYKVIKPFSLIVALALFAAYICGLYFTLRTHASLIWAANSHEARKEEYLRSPSVSSIAVHQQQQQQQQPQIYPIQQSQSQPQRVQSISRQHLAKPSERKITEHEPTKDEHDGSGHDAPNWSRNKSTVILLSATVLYAIIAEILVDNVDSILADFPINPKFLGLTIFALVPNTTEFLNAISFAIGGNVALSMEIGSAYALQVVLIQIPSLVVYSMLKGYVNVEQIFSLVFPRWDIIATLISIYLFTYIYAEGKSNYFKGVILILIYIVVLIGFWFNDIIEELDDGYGAYFKNGVKF
ncbi:calcium:cation antiporter family protein [Acetobacter pasteurianus]|nr:calcium:cation antiporter family protein [Acetobacter pasteurianus]